ncbi:MAG TPA: hypothetical protein VFJ12_01460 [Segeticoccus sp.]|jgi:hypothetical protein|nr:hypothetical protein [Segeticoccus sp.]
MRTSAEVHEVKAARTALGAGLALSILVTVLLGVSAPVLAANGVATGLVIGAVALSLLGGLVVTVLADRFMTPAPVLATDELELAA